MHQNNPDVTIYDLRSPTLEYSEKDPDNVDVFYNGLKSVIENFKSRDNLVIAGDSNSETETAALESNIFRK